MSKLVSNAAAWIVLSFDTPYYTEHPHILQNKTEIETESYVLFTHGSSFAPYTVDLR